MVLVQNLLDPLCCEKTSYGTFPCLVVLASNNKFKLYLYETKKQNKKFQPDSNSVHLRKQVGVRLRCFFENQENKYRMFLFQIHTFPILGTIICKNGQKWTHVI